MKNGTPNHKARGYSVFMSFENLIGTRHNTNQHANPSACSTKTSAKPMLRVTRRPAMPLWFTRPTTNRVGNSITYGVAKLNANTYAIANQGNQGNQGNQFICIRSHRLHRYYAGPADYLPLYAYSTAADST
ncbi:MULTISPECIES: hypothetical protein [unclassified Lysobacter]|uniref:hypothetical protein n=1 Tax=unclassified Lysobacter TaxID=2635362 RepID=UPI001BEBC6FA|nr:MULTISPECIES: hypothetical protein [unclassified Lysobacter]MBT2745869.1 hypothetical protein [Lysobacter sp. ISL-42]MBT2749572.1 hypothetical protein [Lysobacter sp. ISL-50]MBT2778784.1 hypothetical protein [Lysobacter sp. ISL-54]MBT2781379.1 hypothetical protein [Lysobacter sp. ISL-52]